ncbi:hypothetical protein HOD08_00575 [bacterium]|nr:hypothetical protein [bacterium]
MIKFTIITVFPNLHENFLDTSLVKIAKDGGLVDFDFVKLSDLTSPAERIDEPTVGPGPGMILKPSVIADAIEVAEKKHGAGYKIFFSPKGTPLTQTLLKDFSEAVLGASVLSNEIPSTQKHSKTSESKHIILVCGRYEGIDARVEEHYADLMLSIGDYVLMGGDLPAQVFLEGILRLIPGVLGNADSIETESFQSTTLDHPEYGLPVEWKEKNIPEVLLSGHHKKINEWREAEALRSTLENRFDWFSRSEPSEDERAKALEAIPPHYVILMHDQILLKGGKVGTTSITSIDLHDISRSSATYGIKKYFVVTPLEDQFHIIKTFLNFWRSEDGAKYNPSRFKATALLHPVKSLDEAVAEIEKDTGSAPVLVTTCAKKHVTTKKIDFHSQGFIWKKEKPVGLIFGTGQGLSQPVIDRSDFLLAPLNGLSEYNHLSVRSAVGVILDRWLGVNPKLLGHFDKDHC